MGKYDAIDADIVRILEEQGGQTWGAIHHEVEQLHPAQYMARGAECWRLTDRRLQALRRAGKIVPVRRKGGLPHWRIA